MGTGRLMRDLRQHKQQQVNPVPMEVDAIWRQIKGFGKSKGKGKGKKRKGKGDTQGKSKGKGKSKYTKGKGKSTSTSKWNSLGKSKGKGKSNSSSSSRGPCENCGKPGHSKHECWPNPYAMVSALLEAWESSDSAWESSTWDSTWDEYDQSWGSDWWGSNETWDEGCSS